MSLLSTISSLAHWLTWLTPSDPLKLSEPLLGSLVNTMCTVVLSTMIRVLITYGC